MAEITIISPATGVPTRYPFQGYGGIERITADLAHALAAEHSVRLVGGRGSKVEGCEMVEHPTEYDTFLPEYSGIVIDFSHTKYYNYDKHSVPFWSDSMGRKPIFPTQAVMRSFHLKNVPVIMPGIDLSDYNYIEEKQDYYLFLGRIAPYKGTETLLNIARRLQVRIIVAGHEGAFTPPGYVADFRTRCEDAGIEYIGTVSEAKKRQLLEGAKGLIFPPNWRLAYNLPEAVESFGITAVEALASGTPVFTNRLPSGVREIIEGGYGAAYDDREWVSMLFYKRPKAHMWKQRIKFFSAERYGADLLKHIQREAKPVG